MNDRSRLRGFSLTELIAVLVVLSVLLGLAIPTGLALRRAARVTACASNLRQIGQALLAFRAERRTWPEVLPLPLPYANRKMIQMFPGVPSLNDALASYLPPGSPVYHCPGDGEVFNRIASVAGQHGLSYLTWLSGFKFFTVPVSKDFNIVHDFQGYGGATPAESVWPAQFHPPRMGINGLRIDGSVHFDHAQPAS